MKFHGRMTFNLDVRSTASPAVGFSAEFRWAQTQSSKWRYALTLWKVIHKSEILNLVCTCWQVWTLCTPTKTPKTLNKTPKYVKQNTNYTNQNTKYTNKNTKYAKQNTKYAKQNTKYTKQNTKYAKQNAKYAKQNTKYTKYAISLKTNVNLHTKILIYAVLSRDNFCREFTHFLADLLQA